MNSSEYNLLKVLYKSNNAVHNLSHDDEMYKHHIVFSKDVLDIL